MSVGTDGMAHVHSVLQPGPLLSLRVSDSYVFGARWSPVRPLVFVAVTGQGGSNCERQERSTKESPVGLSQLALVFSVFTVAMMHYSIQLYVRTLLVVL